jgi:hypothetical protein
MTKNVGLQGIPSTIFYSEPNKPLGESFVRYCFCKKNQTLEKAAQLLNKWKNGKKWYNIVIGFISVCFDSLKLARNKQYRYTSYKKNCRKRFYRFLELSFLLLPEVATGNNRLISEIILISCFSRALFWFFWYLTHGHSVLISIK